MIVSSASPLSRMVPAKSRCSGVQRRVEQQAAHADHGVHRRADLVAHRRQECALGLVGGLGLRARLLGFLEQAHVLDGDLGLVDEGVHQGDLAVAEGACRLAGTASAPMHSPPRMTGSSRALR